MKSKFLNASIFTKILISTMLLIIIPLTCINIFSYNKIIEISHEEFSAYSLETTKQISSNVDFFLGEMDKITQIISSNPMLQDSLERTGDIDYNTVAHISDFLFNITCSRMDGVTLIVAGTNGDLYYNNVTIQNHPYSKMKSG